jgi:hypothetical protein
MLRFIKAVYEDSRLAVLLPQGQSPEIQLMRGSRQGCPMSPILFDVFINDLFDECKEWGVQVPGIGEKIPGLLYADDSALCAESKDELQVMLQAIQGWADKWGMSFGIAKCGVMAVGGSNGDELVAEPLTLSGKALPVTDCYTYLGVPFNANLDLDRIVMDRKDKAAGALHAIRGVLSNRRIPLPIKVSLVKGSLLPVVCYGGELLGMNVQRVAPLQRVLDEAVRLMVGGRSRGGSATVIAKELGIPSVMQVMTGARVRALKKFASLPTWAGALLSEEATCKLRAGRTWVSNGRMWIRRFGTQDLQSAMLDGPAESGKQCSKLAQKICKQRDWEKALSLKSGQTFSSLRLKKTRKYVSQASIVPRLANGVLELARFRTGCVWTGRRAAKAGLISSRYVDRCPCCETECQGGETIEHVLLHCPAWDSQRRSMEEAVSGITAHAYDGWSTVSKKVWLLGGGEDAALQKLWLVGDSKVPKEDREPGWLAVASFLQGIRTQRCARLWRSATFTTTNQGSLEYGVS